MGPLGVAWVSVMGVLLGAGYSRDDQLGGFAQAKPVARCSIGSPRHAFRRYNWSMAKELTLARIARARRTIAGAVLRTPTLGAPALSELTGARVFVKYENMQVTNSFKERGAINKLASLSEAESARGVIAMSAGNHAQAVAYHARRLGIPATIVMPVTTPFVKVAAT